MARIVIDIPNRVIDNLGETAIVESIKDFLINQYEVPKFEITVRKIKRAPSLRFKIEKKLGDWKLIDRV
ncbi:MAG: hypothetical protein ABH874_06140 [Methanobacteriota archaeon]|jgi:hypothetical protein|nr:hypothetical protein [Candidatus Hydrothermarchaeota archaeon]